KWRESLPSVASIPRNHSTLPAQVPTTRRSHERIGIDIDRDSHRVRHFEVIEPRMNEGLNIDVPGSLHEEAKPGATPEKRERRRRGTKHRDAFRLRRTPGHFA